MPGYVTCTLPLDNVVSIVAFASVLFRCYNSCNVC
jgi:hypothetical protein